MLALILSICLIENPGKCREERMQIMEQVATPFQCMMVAQPEIAKHMEMRPRWVVKKWTCVTEEQLNAYRDM
jgi:hypothetical protein